MLPILEYDLYKYLALAAMLLAILFAYFKGRGADSRARGPSPRARRAPETEAQAVGRLLGLKFLSSRLR